ncbi:hypothetical protein FBU30_008122 [Linnemannia zychae]|nr:hypothetical protein FBU30_008122 [Linnemannia zychae]
MFLSSLPPEIIYAIVSKLDPYRPSLCACVLLSKEYFKIFTPFLWRKISLLHEAFDAAPREYYQDVPYYQRDEWVSKLKRIIEAGGLARNGKWVEKFSCTYLDVYDALGKHTTVAEENGMGKNLQELKVGTIQKLVWEQLIVDPQINLEPLLRILKTSHQLKKLILVKELLDERHPRFMDLLESIPLTVEELELRSWDLKLRKRRYYFTLHYDDEEVEEIDEGLDAFIEKVTSAAAIAPALPCLKTLALRENYGVDINKRTLVYILANSPNLETILLQGASQPVPLQYFTSLLEQHCPKIQNLHLLDWYKCPDFELARLFDASKLGWKTLGLPQSNYNPHEFGPLTTAALLRHAPTLENLRLDGSENLPSATVQQLLCTAPNLKRFDAICKDRSFNADFNLYAQDIVKGADWVCTNLESLKVRIVGIPRPDIKERHSRRPFEPNDPLHSGTMGASRTLQRCIYSQLGRLTRLKQLVLGHDDVEYENGCAERENMSEGEYFDRGGMPENGFQYDCLEMNLESGVDLLKELKEIRTLDLGGMHLGHDYSSQLRFEEWARANWPRYHKAYTDLFWYDFGYLEYY